MSPKNKCSNVGFVGTFVNGLVQLFDFTQKEKIENEIEPLNLVNISVKYSVTTDDVSYDEPPEDHGFGDVLKDADFLYSSVT